MRGHIIKVALSVAVLIGGIAYLLHATAGEAFEYYKHVDEVVPDLAQWQKKPLQIHGYVLPGSIQKRLDPVTSKLEYKFVEVNCDKQLDVHYVGVVPDTFKDGAEVVAKGQLDGERLQAQEIMAKCPSKYQATEAPKTFCTHASN